jgi:glyoxylase-like metal-dependent hydrolase (beta-lactamase superfamily II)
MVVRALAFVALASLSLPPSTIAAQESSSAAEASYRRAREVLAAALEAHGGRARLAAIKTIRLRERGQQHHLHQSLRVDPPFTHAPREEDVDIDVRNVRLRHAIKTAFPGNAFASLTILDGQRGTFVDLGARTATPLPSGRLTSGHSVLRHLPHFILLEADSRAVTLRHLGRATYNGRPADVLSYVRTDGQLATLYVDSADRLLRAMETLVADAGFGDSRTEVRFDAYRRANGIALPTGRAQLSVGEPWLTLIYPELVIDAELESETFVVPAGLTAIAAAPAISAPRTRTLAPGVHLVEGLVNFNSLVIEQAGGLIVLDGPAPTPFARSTELLLEHARAVAPSLPVRWAILTHHHPDHTAGARAYAALGVPMLVTPMAARLIPRFLESRFTIAPDSFQRSPREARLTVMTDDRRRLDDATRPVDVYRVSTSHAAEMLLVHLPRERIVFQADLVTADADGRVGVRIEGGSDLLHIIDRLGLAVETIVGAHGGVTTLERLRAAPAMH